MWDWKKKNNVDCISNSLCCSHRWWTKFLILKFVCTRVNAWNNPQQQEFVWVFQLNLRVEKQAKASNKPTNQPTNYQLLLPHPCHAMPSLAHALPYHAIALRCIWFKCNELYIVYCTLYVGQQIRATNSQKRNKNHLDFHFVKRHCNDATPYHTITHSTCTTPTKSFQVNIIMAKHSGSIFKWINERKLTLLPKSFLMLHLTQETFSSIFKESTF